MTKESNERQDNNADNALPAGWHDLTETPPDYLVEIIDKDGNIGIPQPMYYPFEIVKREGDELKPYGFRGTPVFYEDGKSKWDGSFMILCLGLWNKVGTIVGWKPICK